MKLPGIFNFGETPVELVQLSGQNLEGVFDYFFSV